MSRKNNNQLPNNYPQLQNLIKRDPESYRDEFLQQFNHYRSLLQVFQLHPDAKNETLSRLVLFLAHVSHCYPKDVAEFPEQLFDLLKKNATILHPSVRLTLCQALILLRKRKLVSVTSVLELFFTLFRCEDKLLRKTLYKYIIYDIKDANKKHKDVKMNGALQGFMYTMLKHNNPTAAKMSLDVMVELYKKNVWHDTKTVNVITTACLSKVTKIMVAGLQFFLGKDDENPCASDSDSDEDDRSSAPNVSEVAHAFKVSKKTKRRVAFLKKAKAAVKKIRDKKMKSEDFNFSAIHLVNDPQGFADQLFKALQQRNERIEVKIMLMNLISRLVGIHELFLFNFYPYLQRYLRPHQTDVTKILLFAAQASHQLVPPEIIESVLKTVTNNFVSENNSSDVMAVGLNAVREISLRCPLAMTEDMLRDLTLFHKHKEKSIKMAAKALITLFKDLNRQMLHRKDRGRPTQAMKEQTQLEYGETHTVDFVPGAEVLESDVEEDDEKNNDGWESASDSDFSTDSEGWIDVSHSEDEEDDKEEPTKPQKVLSVEEQRKRAHDIAGSRILTQKDFKLINQRLTAKDLGTDAKLSKRQMKKGMKRSAEEMEDAHKERADREIIPLSNIEMIHKKRRTDKEARLQSKLESQEEGKYSRNQQWRMNPFGSTTNTTKMKNKPFQMVKQKIRMKKAKRSFSEKQKLLKQSLMKKLKAKK